MFQYMPLHWGQIKGASVLVVGTGTYRGRINKSRSCVAEMEEPYFIMKIPESSFDDPQNGKMRKNYDKE